MVNFWFWVRRLVSDILEQPRRRSTSLDRLRQELSPVFVIGGNRSGTSVVTSILAQHPQLEGLFSGSIEPTYNPSGHSIGFCESMHVWHSLIPSDRDRRRNNQLPFWALPQYVSQTYRHRARSDKERFNLAWSVQRLRRSSRHPLIKDQFNMLRVGLIKDVFPRAKLVLVSRSWLNFTERSIHKWVHDGLGTNLNEDDPCVGFQWHLVNLIARYNLEAHAPKQYTEVWLDWLHRGPKSAQESFQKLVMGLSLTPFEFDLGILKSYWVGDEDSRPDSDSKEFDIVKQIVEFERKLLKA